MLPRAKPPSTRLGHSLVPLARDPEIRTRQRSKLNDVSLLSDSVAKGKPRPTQRGVRRITTSGLPVECWPSDWPARKEARAVGLREGKGEVPGTRGRV